MSSPGMFPAAGWHCPNSAKGVLSFHRPINANERAVWIFGDDFAHCAGVVKLCLGTASRPAQLEKTQRVLSVVLAYNFLPYDLVGIHVRGHRVDVRESFCITAAPGVATWRLRGTGNAARNRWREFVTADQRRSSK